MCPTVTFPRNRNPAGPGEGGDLRIWEKEGDGEPAERTRPIFNPEEPDQALTSRTRRGPRSESPEGTAAWQNPGSGGTDGLQLEHVHKPRYYRL